MPDPYSFMAVNGPQGASYASPLIGMALGQTISQYPNDYFQGTQRARTLSLQAPILDPNTGQPSNDPNTIISELQRRGGAEYSEKLLPFIYGAQADQRMADVFAGNMPGGTTQTSSPPSYATPGRANPAQNNPAAASPANLTPRPNSPPAMGGPNDQGANTLRGIATEIAGGREITPLISGAARQLGLHPDQPLNLQQAEQVKQFLRNVALPPNPGQGGAQNNPQRTGVDNGGAPYQPVSGATGSAAPSQGQPQAPTTGGPPFAPNINPNPQGQRVVSPSVQPSDPTLGGLIPQQWVDQGRTASQYRDLLAATAGGRMVSEGARQAALARVKAIDEYMAKTGEQAQQSALTNQQLTPEQKNVNSGASYTGELDKRMGEAVAKAPGEVIDSARSAQKRIAQLSIIKDALMRGEGHIDTGPFAEIALKSKEAMLNSLPFLKDYVGPGTAESEVAQKIGFGLATQAVKEFTSRGTQMELARALQNNPGLLLTPRGSVLMVDVMGQMARQDIELSKLAQDRRNWTNWQDVQDRFYQEHPILSPFDRSRPLTLQDLKSVAGQGPLLAGTTDHIPPEAIDHLRANPALRGYFDQKYGAGSSDQILRGAR